MRTVVAILLLLAAMSIDAATFGPERPLEREAQRIRSRETLWDWDAAGDGNGAYIAFVSRNELVGYVLIGQRIDADGNSDFTTQTVLAAGQAVDLTFAGEHYFGVTANGAPVTLHAIGGDGTRQGSVTVAPNATDAVVAADRDHVLVAWRGDGGWLAIYDHELRQLVAPRRFAAPEEPIASLAAAATDGAFGLVWSSQQTIRGAHIAPDGTATRRQWTFEGSSLSLTAGRADFLLVWNLGTRVIAQVLSPEMLRRGGSWEVTATAAERTQPNVSHVDGEFVVAWHDGAFRGVCRAPATLRIVRASAEGVTSEPLAARFEDADVIDVAAIVSTPRGPMAVWEHWACATGPSIRASHLPVTASSVTSNHQTILAEHVNVFAGGDGSTILAGRSRSVPPDVAGTTIERLTIPDFSVRHRTELLAGATVVAAGGGRQLLAWSYDSTRVRLLDSNGTIVGGDELWPQWVWTLDAEWIGDRFLVTSEENAAYVYPNDRIERFPLKETIGLTYDPVMIVTGGPAPLLAWARVIDGRADRTSAHVAPLHGTTVGPQLRLEGGHPVATFAGDSYLALTSELAPDARIYRVTRIDATGTTIVTPAREILRLPYSAGSALFTAVPHTPLAVVSYASDLLVVDLAASLACGCLDIRERLRIDGRVASLDVKPLSPTLLLLSYLRFGRADERGVGSRAYIRLLSLAPARRRVAR